MSINLIDDFFVTNGSYKSLAEHLECWSVVNKDVSRLTNKDNLKNIKYKLYKELISDENSCVLYRQQTNASDALVRYWLSNVKKISHLYGVVNNIPKFEGITKEYIREIVNLSTDINNLKKLEGILSGNGIIFIVEKSIDSLKTDGAVYINDNGHAVVSLSLRYNRLDNFWFTLIHELAHLHLHQENLKEPIIEDLEIEDNLLEKQANMLARELLIPRAAWRSCPCKYDNKESVLRKFASSIGVHPSIVAGRIRFEQNNFTLYKDIINEVDVREIFST